MKTTIDNPITLEQARGLLARAVMTQGPSFRYHDGDKWGCVNVPVTRETVKGTPHNGQLVAMHESLPEDSPKRKTGCLVGTAMKLSGVVPEESFPPAGQVAVFFDYLDPNAQAYFATAQRKQDGGSTWGEAYAVAEAHIPTEGETR